MPWGLGRSKSKLKEEPAQAQEQASTDAQGEAQAEAPQPVSGPSFPEEVKIWTGGKFKYLGFGIKYKQVLFVKIQLYAIAFYVEEEEAVKELERMKKEGFFKDFSDAEMCSALLQGKFKKFFQIQLLRNVTYGQFIGEIGRDLKPRLEQLGDETLWPTFADYFKEKDLSRGSDLLAVINDDETCDGGLFPPNFKDFEHAEATLHFTNPGFAAALMDVYIGPQAIVPDAVQKWAQAGRSLLNGPAST